MSTKTKPVTMEQSLDSLRQKLAGDDTTAAWLHIGDAIAQLEALSPKRDDGSPWLEVVREFHAQLGNDRLSLGHLQKIRRVRNFVRAVLRQHGNQLSDNEIGAAQLSALEVADRLHSIDPDKGYKALLACIRDKRSFADMRRAYESFVEQNPLLLPKKQSTWLEKRKATVRDSPDTALVETVLMSDPECYLGTSSAVLRAFDPGQLSYLLRKTDCGFRIVTQDGEQWLGVEVVKARPVAQRDYPDFLSTAEFQATFFDRYWLFFDADHGLALDVSKLLSELLVEHIGIASRKDDEWHVIKRPTELPPFPRRRQWLAEQYRR